MIIPKLSKMCYQLILVLYLQVTIINAAPLFLLPIPWTAPSTQQFVLQKQLMEMQALQQLNAQSPFQMNQQQPVMVLLPNDQPSPNMNMKQKFDNLNNENDSGTHTAHTNFENEEDLNSIIIDAAPETDNQDQAVNSKPQRAVLLIPNGRLSIGDIISAIPFLPIEINVPDTISWIYNGIAGGIGSIITIFGRPFQGTAQQTVQEAGFKSLLKQMEMRQQNILRPIVMMPFNGPILPIRV